MSPSAHLLACSNGPVPTTLSWMSNPASIFSIRGVSPKVSKVIHMLRLGKIFSGTFVRISPTSVSMMKVVEPYIAWGWVWLTLPFLKRFFLIISAFKRYAVFQADFPT